MQECFFLGWPLPGGNCAEWFSGSASAAAVAVALAGYFYSEIKRRNERKDRLHDALANASMILNACLTETAIVYAMATEEPVSLRANGKDYVIPRLNRGVTPTPISDLSASEYNLIIKSIGSEIGKKMSLIVRSANNLLNGFAEYSQSIDEIEPILRRNALLPVGEELICSESESGSMFSAAMASSSILPGLTQIARAVLQSCEEFNDELEKVSGGSVFKLDLRAAQNMIEGNE